MRTLAAYAFKKYYILLGEYCNFKDFPLFPRKEEKSYSFSPNFFSFSLPEIGKHGDFYCFLYAQRYRSLNQYLVI
jgi:hypothetical protein